MNIELLNLYCLVLSIFCVLNILNIYAIMAVISDPWTLSHPPFSLSWPSTNVFIHSGIKTFLTLLILDLICHLQRWLDPQVSAGLLCIVAGLLGDEHLLGLLGLQGGVEQWRPLQIGLALLGKFCATARWAGTQTLNSSWNYFSHQNHIFSLTLVFVYTAEMFPTEIRQEISELSLY